VCLCVRVCKCVCKCVYICVLLCVVFLCVFVFVFVCTVKIVTICGVLTHKRRFLSTYLEQTDMEGGGGRSSSHF